MTDAVADTGPDAGDPSTKRGKLPLIIGVILAVIGGGGGFYAAQSGLLPFGFGNENSESSDSAEHSTEMPVEALADPMTDISEIAFVPLDPIHLSMGQGREAQQLRMVAQLEVRSDAQADVEKLLPRVTDVLNSYLRALKVSDLQDPVALTRIRSQMLRRINIVTGRGRVRDLLVMEFVLN
ncbi:flagellar basal body-associated FliL family protein [Aliisedimentitalea scapharcae]|uniref:Flagellar protein FliL n=1 Tax=Aliisedimentitalea scapharcae TaxID=1524259 RepID=A0ABZ2XUW4_9RHOB|nr:flagellar basal body-associated FliL family protein [Rhodobacteraceae bacterium M382]